MANEKRLIKVCDATAVYNGIVLYMAENAYLNDTPLDVLKMVADWLNEAPTVDAVEVVHGRWESWGIFDDLAKCSVCGAGSFTMHFVHYHNFKHCPNCGAKMN